MEEQKNPQVQIGLTPEVGVGVYANLALITHSNTDFVHPSRTGTATGAQPCHHGSRARKASLAGFAGECL